jgi:hypothetical protein
VTLALESVLIREAEARTPRAYDGLAADAPWRVAGVWTASDGSRHVVEIGFGSLEAAVEFASSELAISGRWDDPDQDGNYCLID